MNSRFDEFNFKQSLAFFESELFKDVQLKGLFNDSKTFADALPKAPLKHIFSQYETQKQSSDFDLAHFVAEHFVLPKRPDLQLDGKQRDLSQHINALWSLLTRPADDQSVGQSADSLLPLQKPYIIPGGRFSEVYYWDSYFTALGLIKQGKALLVTDILDNFVELQQAIGLIPNGNRSYYHSRSQPPILALMVDLLKPLQSQPQKFITKYLPALEAEYQFWMQGQDKLDKPHQALKRVVKMPDGTVLNRYWDDNTGPRPESYREDVHLAKQFNQTGLFNQAEQFNQAGQCNDSKQQEFLRHIRAACESGWDFSSRWLRDSHNLTSIETTHIVPIDLNCLLYQLEQTLAQSYRALANEDKAQQMQSLASARQRAINRYLWCEKSHFYFDYHWVDKKRKETYSLAGSLPLFVKIADKSQASSVAKYLADDFLAAGGLLTTLNQTEQQWDSPNGWAPLQWFSVMGLRHYQYDDLAQQIMERWLNTVTNFFEQHGKLMEKYNVCQLDNQAGGGEYQVQEGFGWTNGVTIAFMDMI